jgi:F0F1-type ATP synthase delta subunit
MEGLDLSNFFTTKAQATDFADRLSRIESELYETDFELESELQKFIGIKRKDKFLTLLRENKIPIDSKQALTKFFESVREEISTRSEVTITFAIEPDQEILFSISSWFLLNIGKQVLIDTEIDQGIIAGTIINYQGKWFDSSVKKNFENLVNPSEGSQINPEEKETTDTKGSESTKNN